MAAFGAVMRYDLIELGIAAVRLVMEKGDALNFGFAA
jgi:hypothetical protein